MTITTFIFLAIGAFFSWGWFNLLKQDVIKEFNNDTKTIEDKVAIAMCTGMLAMGVPLFFLFYLLIPIS